MLDNQRSFKYRIFKVALLVPTSATYRFQPTSGNIANETANDHVTNIITLACVKMKYLIIIMFEN